MEKSMNQRGGSTRRRKNSDVVEENIHNEVLLRNRWSQGELFLAKILKNDSRELVLGQIRLQPNINTAIII